MQADWNLSQSLTADGSGIRCIAVLPPAADDTVNRYRLVAGNQSGGLIEFSVPSGALNAVPFQHDHAVTAILSSSTWENDGCYVTACKDGVVRWFDSNTHTLIGSCQGHDKPVASLAWCDTKERWLVSGSWDGTAKVWSAQDYSLVATLPNHENSVCVARVTDSIRDGSFVTLATGSAGVAQGGQIMGHSIRLWQVNVDTGEVVLTHTVSNDHDGPIRDISAVMESSPWSSSSSATATSTARLLATCSNDGTVKLRDASTGIALSTLVFFANGEHPPMLLSVTSAGAAGDSYIAAGAEDGHLVVWDTRSRDTNDTTSADETTGDPQMIRHAACLWSVVSVPDGDLATACQDGTLRIFTRATERVASTAECEEFVADTQRALGATRKGPTPEEIAKLPLWEQQQQVRGTSEGQIHLFNKGGIAIAAQWSAMSQTWIEVGEVTGQADGGTVDGVSYDHVFPIEVDQPNGGVATLQIGYNNGENPFTAAQRFVDTHMLSQNYMTEIADYITQRTGQKPSTVLGETASTTAGFAGSPIASYQCLPAKTYKAFEMTDKVAATTLAKMKDKIQQFGVTTELAHITSLMTTLAASNRYHASTVSTDELRAVSDLLEHSSPAQSFPALDLARLTVLHPDAAGSNRSLYWSAVLRRTVALCQISSEQALDGPAATAVPMLSLRLFANAFKSGSGSRDAAATLLDSMVDCAGQYIRSSHKNVRLSVATLLYNICFYLHQSKNGDAHAVKIVPLLHEILTAKMYESEAIVRALVALGTLILATPLAKEAANSLFLATKVELAASPHGDEAKQAAREVYSLL